MPRFAANLSMLYPELPFLDRFEAAARDGFDAVEYLFPYEHHPQDIADRLQAYGLTQALFNLPPGDWNAGERGVACLPGRESEFAEGLQQALRYARTTGCRRLHAMAGIPPQGVCKEQAHTSYLGNLRLAARALAAQGIMLLIEPINDRDMPGYLLNYQQQAHDVVAESGASNIRVQMDFYHCQVMEGDLLRRLQRHFNGIGHIQIAGVPDRHEPDQGEVHFPFLFDELDRLGYSGFVGCEYRPAGDTSKGLDWLRRYRESRKADA